MRVGDNRINEKIIELSIPLEFSIQNNSKKTINIPTVADFTSPIWDENIKGGLNSSFYFNKRVRVGEQLSLSPDEQKNVILYYNISILNSNKECIFEKYASLAKQKDTIFLDNEDSCLKKYASQIKGTDIKFHNLSAEIIVSNSQ